ncbi:MAG: hypothetical protein QE278_04885 [Limnobacter sp.]|nr:hypothetical protein [Limnobacter sp.]
MTTHNTPDNMKPAKASLVHLIRYRKPALPPRYTLEYKALELMAHGHLLDPIEWAFDAFGDLSQIIDWLIKQGWPVEREKEVNPLLARYRISRDTARLFGGIHR